MYIVVHILVQYEIIKYYDMSKNYFYFQDDLEKCLVHHLQPVTIFLKHVSV